MRPAVRIAFVVVGLGTVAYAASRGRVVETVTQSLYSDGRCLTTREEVPGAAALIWQDRAVGVVGLTLAAVGAWPRRRRSVAAT